jgi:hypothetical protein
MTKKWPGNRVALKGKLAPGVLVYLTSEQETVKITNVYLVRIPSAP